MTFSQEILNIVSGRRLTDSNIYTGTWVHWDTGRPVRVNNPHTDNPGAFHRYIYEVAKRGDNVRLEMLDIFEATEEIAGAPRWYYKRPASGGPGTKHKLTWDEAAKCYTNTDRLKMVGGVWTGYILTLTYNDDETVTYREFLVTSDGDAPFEILEDAGYLIRHDLVEGRFVASPPQIDFEGMIEELNKRMDRLENQLRLVMGNRRF